MTPVLPPLKILLLTHPILHPLQPLQHRTINYGKSSVRLHVADNQTIHLNPPVKDNTQQLSHTCQLSNFFDSLPLEPTNTSNPLDLLPTEPSDKPSTLEYAEKSVEDPLPNLVYPSPLNILESSTPTDSFACMVIDAEEHDVATLPLVVATSHTDTSSNSASLMPVAPCSEPSTYNTRPHSQSPHTQCSSDTSNTLTLSPCCH
ncbi:hypothetical protein Salat_0742500 [Sesamum alatum]|uniref:Uncharacterized protein n=1 Tax=Sesamum alatum TaxID=300844 RepID=A0AAE1YSR3_9LAMI|nr:hypothetical protein Salat_0742500 [Sesamum alatum]